MVIVKLYLLRLVKGKGNYETQRPIGASKYSDTQYSLFFLYFSVQGWNRNEACRCVGATIKGSTWSDCLVLTCGFSYGCEDWHMLLVITTYDAWDMTYREHPYCSLDNALPEMNLFPESTEPSIPLRVNAPVINLDASLRTIIDLLHQEMTWRSSIKTSSLISKIINVLSEESNGESFPPLPSPVTSFVHQMWILPFGITCGRKIPLQTMKGIESIFITILHSIVMDNSFWFADVPVRII